MKNILIHKSPDLSVTYFVDNLNIDGVHVKAQNMLDFGTLYRIGTIDELPADRTFRGAWDIDDADLNDGVAGEDAVITRVERLTLMVESNPTVSTLSAQVVEATTTANTLSAEAGTDKQTWEQHKQQAFEAKTTWETHLSAAEAAELTVTTAGTSATSEERQQAIELRVTADTAWKTQDDMFALKRAFQESEALATDAASDLEQLTQQLEGVQNTQDQLAEAQQQLDQLREILPLDARRDRNTTNTTES